MQGQLGEVFSTAGRSMIGSTSFIQLLKMLKAFRLVRLMKLLRIAKLSLLLSRYQDHFFLFAPIITITKQVGILIFLGHLAGCCFFFFSASSWHTRFERKLIAADELTTWKQAELFAQDMFVPPATERSAEAGTASWVEIRATDANGNTLYCPHWYSVLSQDGDLVCRSMQGFTPRYVAALYWCDNFSCSNGAM